MITEVIQEREKREKRIREIKCVICTTKLKGKQRATCSKSCKSKYDYLCDKQITQRWKAKSPENYIFILLCRSNRKELKLQKDKVIEIYYNQKGLCAISKVPMTYIVGSYKIPTNISIDKINANKGYTLDNIQFVCDIVNKMKWTSTKEELLFWCNQIIKNN